MAKMLISGVTEEVKIKAAVLVESSANPTDRSKLIITMLNRAYSNFERRNPELAAETRARIIKQIKQAAKS